ncbi:MAG: 23S rRNA (uracil(1939)-C(5))-methyltransferase RlmD [Candidatus Omnitrophota bacterium]|nr:23S rRNA (uracil(1939)-C(5))-methyltransferase RlmD [Candidatus Omnitrophota bacterium]
MRVIIEKIIYPGKSLSRHNGKIILTDEGVPGEEVEIIPLKEKTNYIEAKTSKIIKPSRSRIQPHCSHYQVCSTYQYIDYPTQIKFKQDQLKEIMSHSLKINLTQIKFRESPQTFNYRNKITLSIIWDGSRACLAYTLPKTINQFIKIEECFLVSPQINNTLSLFIKTITANKLNFINKVTVKESWNKKEILLVIYGNAIKEIKNLADKFDVLKKLPICGIVYITKNPKTKHIIKGNDFIKESIDETSFLIGSESFFQINIPLLKTMANDIKKSFLSTNNKTIADLYCGVGTFGILLASAAHQVIGVESEQENISFLKKNLEINKINNFIIKKGDCQKIIPSILKNQIDILILDPPRKGLDKKICHSIIKNPPSRIAYVSCNPSTLTRDLKILLSLYKLKDFYAYDFFPQTPHMETLTILSKC